MKLSMAEKWKDSIQASLQSKKNQWGMLSGYPAMIDRIAKGGGRFAKWDQYRVPDGIAQDDLAAAVDFGAVMPSHEYYRTFLSWSNEAADRALSDIRFDIDPEAARTLGIDTQEAKTGWRIEGSYPGNHGRTLAAGCFARSLREGTDLDSSSLLKAAEEIAESALYGGVRSWDYIAQSEYLRSIRLALVAGDGARAQKFFDDCKRKFKNTYVHEQWLRRLVADVIEADGAQLSEAGAQHFQNFFDQVRDPEATLPKNQTDGTDLFANISILRLELAIIKQRYVLKKPFKGAWTSVLALVSE